MRLLLEGSKFLAALLFSFAVIFFSGIFILNCAVEIKLALDKVKAKGGVVKTPRTVEARP